MKLYFLAILVVSSFLYTSNNEIKGTWKIELYTTSKDTIYKENHPEFTKKYFEKLLVSVDESEEKKLKIQKSTEDLYESIKAINLFIDKKTIKSFKIGDFQNEIKINYTIENDKIILDKKQNEKYKYNLEYNSKNDKLTLQDENKFLKVEYSRLK